jgi:hypothetical protein
MGHCGGGVWINRCRSPLWPIAAQRVTARIENEVIEMIEENLACRLCQWSF